MNNFVYAHEVSDIDPEHSWLVVVPEGIDTEEQLIDFILKALKFPDYFGRNWDAFSSCMRDLGWIEKKNIVIQHLDLPLKSDNDDKRLYLKVMEYISSYWVTDERHNVSIIFRPEDKNQILKEIGTDLSVISAAMRRKDERAYRAMDWETEIERVRRAFGVEDCEFDIYETADYSSSMRFLIDSHSRLPEVLITGGGKIRVAYTVHGMTFHITSQQNKDFDAFFLGYDGRIDDGHVSIEDDSAIDDNQISIENERIFARALFHLDLLTPKVEATLQVRISDSEKAEWLLEYAARLEATGKTL